MFEKHSHETIKFRKDVLSISCKICLECHYVLTELINYKMAAMGIKAGGKFNIVPMEKKTRAVFSERTLDQTKETS